VNYQAPAIEQRESIDRPFVLGITYVTPTWTKQPDKNDRDR